MFPLIQYFKNDLMRQLDSQVNDFMDSLIEESASLEPTPLPAVFSPLMSDKEKNKLRCGLNAGLRRISAFTYPIYIFLAYRDLTLFILRQFRPPHGQGKLFLSRRSLLE